MLPRLALAAITVLTGVSFLLTDRITDDTMLDDWAPMVAAMALFAVVSLVTSRLLIFPANARQAPNPHESLAVLTFSFSVGPAFYAVVAVLLSGEREFSFLFGGLAYLTLAALWLYLARLDRS